MLVRKSACLQRMRSTKKKKKTDTERRSGIEGDDDASVKAFCRKTHNFVGFLRLSSSSGDKNTTATNMHRTQCAVDCVASSLVYCRLIVMAISTVAGCPCPFGRCSLRLLHSVCGHQSFKASTHATSARATQARALVRTISAVL